MSGNSDGLAPRPNLPLFAYILRIPLLPAIAAKHFLAFIYSLALAMGRTVLGRADFKRYRATSPEKELPAVQIEETTCLICQETIGTRNAEGLKEGFSMLPCGHRFGSRCIKRYLAITADEQPLCPICRHVAYHDACGHPVLPFLLNRDGTHPDLIADKTGKLRPPKCSGEELMTALCEYCLLPDEEKNKPEKKLPGRLETAGMPFRWLRAMLPFPRKKKNTYDHQRTTSQENTTGQDHRLSRQEARNRRRTPASNGNWEGPWMDVQSRDVGWETWWKAQAPREV